MAVASSVQIDRALRDLVSVVARWTVWVSLARADIRSKYRLSTFGSLWITLTTGGLAVAIGLIYGQFFDHEVHSYLPYFTASYVTWTFIVSVITEASFSLVAYGNLIKSSQLPIIFHILRMLQRNLIIALHNFIVVAAIWPFVRWPLHLTAVLSLAGLVLLYLFLVGASTVIAICCVRYRDLPPLIQVLTQFLFFLTPIMWFPEQIKVGALILKFNPLAYLLVVVRDPILGRTVEAQTWIIAAALAAVSLSVGSLMYVRFRHRVAFWV